ncbi:hypothetical protein MDOR_38470 [Mycolicibacterium doricum]|nr:hypothetical protein MDOR_38470 [Mycolicibacterium doricum]
MKSDYQDAEDRDEPVPDDFSITFRYSDMRGRRYEDTYELSLSTLLDQTGSYPANTDDNGMRRRLVKALEAIARGVGRH